MSLPLPWVERMFEKLTLVYGHQFLSRWDGLDLSVVKADWAHELRGFQQNPGAIAYALEHLPAGKPPTVLEFRAICNTPHAPNPDQRAIAHDHTPAKPERVASEVAKLGDLRTQRRRDPRQWAYDLAEKDRTNPKSVTPTVRAMYQAVLKNPAPVGDVG